MSALHEIVRTGRNIAPSTKARYLRDLDTWIAYAGEDPNGWTNQRAQDFYDHLIEPKGGKLLPQSANRVMASLQYASKWWSHRQQNPRLDFAYVQKARGKNFIEKHALSEEDATKLLGACAGIDPASLRDRAIIVTSLETGMRRMSLIAMTIEQTSLVTIDRKNYPATLVPMKGTAGELVSVPLSDTAIAAILPWRRWLAGHRVNKGPLFSAIGAEMRASGVTTVASKQPFSTPAIGQILTRRATEAGIGKIYPHMFRHTFVTWRMAAGLAPHEIASVTGHTIKGFGALAGYIDMHAIAEKVRNSTPAWLQALITGAS